MMNYTVNKRNGRKMGGSAYLYESTHFRAIKARGGHPHAIATYAVSLFHGFYGSPLSGMGKRI